MGIPDSLQFLPNLEKLDLGWNSLRNLPAWPDGLEEHGPAVLL
jgi:hypothetical protein